MPGTKPLHFFCTHCRRLGRHHYSVRRIVRTGRTRPKNDGRSSGRSTSTEHEYRCGVCGHVGWSRHVDMRGFPIASQPA